MTLFESLNDLLTIVNKLDKNKIGFVIGKQQETPSPDKLYTLVMFYTDYGILYHESNVHNTPGDAAIVDEHKELFKKLNIENSDVEFTGEPKIKIKSLPEDKSLLDKMLNVKF